MLRQQYNFYLLTYYCDYNTFHMLCMSKINLYRTRVVRRVLIILDRGGFLLCVLHVAHSSSVIFSERRSLAGF
jgi:hypothetical protein